MTGHPVPDGPHPSREMARDARRRVYAEDRRRAAARALDRYIETYVDYGADPATIAAKHSFDAGEDFVAKVGDYVLSRLGERGRCPIDGSTTCFEGDAEQGLHHSSHSGVTAGPVCTCATRGHMEPHYAEDCPHRSPDYGVPPEAPAAPAPMKCPAGESCSGAAFPGHPAHSPEVAATPICAEHGQPLVKGLNEWVCACSLGSMPTAESLRLVLVYGEAAGPEPHRAGCRWPAGECIGHLP